MSFVVTDKWASCNWHANKHTPGLMPHTRQPSRVGTMPKTYQHPHSSSHTPLTSEASLHASDRMTVQVAQRAGEYSLQRTSPANRSTQGFCRNCRSNVGEFYNSWHKITGSYYVPALAASYRSLLKHAGKQKAASKGTAIEGW